MTWMKQYLDRLKAASRASDEAFEEIIAGLENETDKAELIRHRKIRRRWYFELDADSPRATPQSLDFDNQQVSSMDIDTAGGESNAGPFSEPPSLPERFQLLRLLGRGSFGSVWEAFDGVLERRVAIKVLNPQRAAQFNLARFKRESQAAARLQHPYLAQVLDVDSHNGTPFMVNKLVEGCSLSQWMKDRPPSPRDAARLMRDIAGAVAHAHEHGVIHRDLKPQNVIIDSRNRPHIVDFGLARIEFADATMTAEGALLGTLAYMSPEQADGRSHDADARSDVYSLGVILYELTTGERPFHGSGPELLRQIAEQQPHLDKETAKDVPFDLRTICLKCLQHNRKHRYENAGQLADDLNRFLDHRPIEARPVSIIGRLIRWRQRNPKIALLMFLLAVVGIVSTWFAVEWRHAARVAQVNAKDAKDSALAAMHSAEESERTLYHTRMNLVFQALTDGNFAAAKQLVELYQGDHPPARHRGFEWYLAATQFCRHRVALSHGESPVRCLLYGPDGRTLLTGGSDGRLSVWDTRTGTPKRSLDVTVSDVCCINAAPDWSRIAIGTGAGYSDPETQPGKVHLLTFPDLVEERVIAVDPARAVTDVAFSPEGDRIATAVGFLGWEDNQPGAGRGSLKIWDVATGDLVQPLAGRDSPTGADPPSMTRVEFISANVVASVMKPGQLNLWDVEKAKVVQTLNFGSIPGLAFDSGRTRIAIADKGVWEISPDFKFTHGVMGLATEGRSLAFSADGWGLAVGNRNGEVVLRDTETSDVVKRLTGHTGPVHAIAFSPDSSELATAGGDANVMIWNVQRTPNAIKNMKAARGMTEIEFSNDGKLVAVGLREGSAKVWDVASGAVVFHEYGHMPEVCDIAFSPNSRLIATAGTRDGTVKVWSLDGGQPLHEFEKTGASEVDFSPDGRNFVHAIGSRVLIRDTQTNWQVSREISLQGEEVNAVAFSPNGKWLAVGTANPVAVEIFEVASWRQHHRISGFTGIAEVDFSPDGNELLVCQHRLHTSRADPASVEVWDITARKHRGTLRGHEEATWSADYSPDGKRIVTGGIEGGIKLWDAGSLTQIVSIHQTDVSLATNAVEFSPDGRLLAVGGNDQLHIFDARPGYSRHSAAAATSGGLSDESAARWRLPRSSQYKVTIVNGNPDEIEIKLSLATDVLFTNNLAIKARNVKLESAAREQLVAEPKWQSDNPQYAALELGRGDDALMTVVIDEAENDALLYVDQNNNEDLTDDPPLSWQVNAWPAAVHMFVPVAVEAEGRKHQTLIALMRHRDSADRPLGFLSNSARVGSFVLRGKPYRVFLYDQNGDGCYDDLHGNTLLLDRNGNSQFDTGSSEWLYGHMGVHIQGMRWRVKSCSADGSRLILMRDDKAREPMTHRPIGFPVPAYEGRLVSGEPHVFETVSKSLTAQMVLIWDEKFSSERMFPAFKLLAQRYQTDSVRFSTLCVCGDERIANARISRLGLGVPHLFDAHTNNKGRLIFAAGQVPHLCVLDRFGFLVYSGNDSKLAENALRRLLRQADRDDAI